MRFIAITIIFMFSFLLPLAAQVHPAQNVHLFQSHYRDALVTSSPYVDGGLEFDNYDHCNNFMLGFKAGLPVTPKFDVTTGLHFLKFSPDHGDGSSGLTDIWLSGKYRIENIFRSKTSFAAGGFVTLPVGDKDIGQNKFNFGTFGAIRHPLSKRFTLTGVFGLDFVEKASGDQTSSLLFGTGLIYTYDQRLNFVGELQLQSEYDYSNLTVGTDYLIRKNGHIRGALGVGLDDGAPDFSILLSYLLTF